jgi:hypothetical protein
MMGIAGLRAEEHPLDVHAVDTVEVRFRRRLDRPDVDDARDVGQDVDAARRFLDRTHGGDGVGAAAHVAALGIGLAARSHDAIGHSACRRFVHVQHGHPRTLLPEQQRDRLPDSRSAPRDDGALVGELEHG